MSDIDTTQTVPEGPTDPRFATPEPDEHTTVLAPVRSVPPVPSGAPVPPAAPVPSGAPVASAVPAPSGPPADPGGGRTAGRVYATGETPHRAGPERGRTTIADRVVERTIERIVDLAAGEVAGVHGLHTGAGDQPDQPEPVTVQLDGDRARIDIAIEVAFGHPLHEVVQHVRETVISESERLLGLTVTEVNVLVAEVVVDAAG